MNKECIFIKAWIGKCKNKTIDSERYCKEHIDMVCCSCGKKATQECPETSALVCGAPLCDNCSHHYTGGMFGGHLPRIPKH